MMSISLLDLVESDRNYINYEDFFFISTCILNIHFFFFLQNISKNRNKFSLVKKIIKQYLSNF